MSCKKIYCLINIYLSTALKAKLQGELRYGEIFLSEYQDKKKASNPLQSRAPTAFLSMPI